MPAASTMAHPGPPRPLTANQQRAMAIEANPVFWRTMTVQGIVDRLIEAVEIQDVLLVVHGLQQLQKAFHRSTDVFRFGLAQRHSNKPVTAISAAVVGPESETRAFVFRLLLTNACDPAVEALLRETLGDGTSWAKTALDQLAGADARIRQGLLGTPLFLLSLDLRSVAVFVDKHFTDSAAPLAAAAGRKETVTQPMPPLAKRPPSPVVEPETVRSKRQCLDKQAKQLGRGPAQGGPSEIVYARLYGLSPLDRDDKVAEDLFTLVHDCLGTAPAGFCLSEDHRQAKFVLCREEEYLLLLEKVNATRFRSSTLFVNRDPPTRCQPQHPRVEIEPWLLSRGPAELYNLTKTLRIGAYCPLIEPASTSPTSPPAATGQASATRAREEHGKASFRVPSIAAAELAVHELAKAQIDRVGAITATWSHVSESKRSLPTLALDLSAASEAAGPVKASSGAVPSSAAEQSSPAPWRYEVVGAASSPCSADTRTPPTSPLAAYMTEHVIESASSSSSSPHATMTSEAVDPPALANEGPPSAASLQTPAAEPQSTETNFTSDACGGSFRWAKRQSEPNPIGESNKVAAVSRTDARPAPSILDKAPLDPASMLCAWRQEWARQRRMLEDTRNAGIQLGQRRIRHCSYALPELGG